MAVCLLPCDYRDCAVKSAVKSGPVAWDADNGLPANCCATSVFRMWNAES
jgi:hypothetical protein